MNIEVIMEILSKGIHGYYYTHNNGYEIMKKSGDSWKMRKINQGEWINFKIDNAVKLFNEKGLNIKYIEVTLLESISTEIVYLDYRLKKLIEFIGVKEYKRTLESWENFTQGLKKAIENIHRKENIKLLEKE